MKPNNFSNLFNSAPQEIRYARGLSRKRQIINAHLEELHVMYLAMIEDAVLIKQSQGFPEAQKVINHIRSL